VPKLQLLVTFRYNGSINHGIESTGRLEIRAHNDDIKTYLTARIRHFPLLARLIGEDQSLHHEILKSVSKKANGMYIRSKS